MLLFKTNICVVNDDPIYRSILFKYFLKNREMAYFFSSGIDIVNNLDNEPDIIFIDCQIDLKWCSNCQNFKEKVEQILYSPCFYKSLY